MPELPEVETVCRDLNQVLPGQSIAHTQVLRPATVAYPHVEGFIHELAQQRFSLWHRRGKYLLGSLDNHACLVVHLRMTGQLLWIPPSDSMPLSPHTRLRWHLASGAELRFVDQRTFGQVWLISPNQQPEAIITGLGSLGPEPFDPAFSSDYLLTSLQKSRRPIKSALLDQTFVAGIGNIYADEALFLSGIHPQTPSHQIGRLPSQRLHQQIIAVLQTSIAQRGTTFSTYRDMRGVNGNYQGLAWVYNREGDPCRRCHTPIVRIKLAGRSAHFCPQCQPAPQ